MTAEEFEAEWAEILADPNYDHTSTTGVTGPIGADTAGLPVVILATDEHGEITQVEAEWHNLRKEY